MMQETTSLTLKRALRKPGTAAHTMPPTIDAAMTSGSSSGRGRPAVRASTLASRPPISIWPGAPMLKSPVLKAKVTERPVSMSGTA